MGNHVVGKMFIAGIATITDEKIEKMEQEKALRVLDLIGKVVVSSTSLDAEFDDHLNPNQRLGRILIKAFSPEKYNDWKNESSINDDMFDDWDNLVYKPFCQRFGFW